ncbi:hypothetical protein [Actinokineospora globicatena]|uniref:Uncharacterized protein n=1 Tax=Actinokineospora globicatena TaxID=103729 RepID=A0A9W6QPH8_9PSEU|nr:hypothetical protein [Actinokineospora globicatena]GLW92287.1 hypothetical protein Aglo03_31030 [Actinokineospora globicatena]
MTSPRDENYDIWEHPELKDSEWLAQVRKGVREEARAIRKQRRGSGRKVTLVLAIGLVLGAIAFYANSDPVGADGVVAAAAPPVHPVTSAAPAFDVTRPFDGSLAATWAEGEAAIVLPEATPVGTHSAEQVRAALELTKRIVVTGRLDRSVIEKDDAEKVLALMAPTARDMWHEQLASRPSSVSSLYTKIDPRYPLLPATPRVKGSMSVREHQGFLVVHVDYSIAYAFAVENPTRASDIVAIAVTQADYHHVDLPGLSADLLGVVPGESADHSLSMACEPAKRGLLVPLITDPAYRSGSTDASPTECA